MTEGGGVTERSVGGRGDYDHLAPLFVELAALDHDDPRRAELRERIVTEHLPVADNIARRYRNRGVPQQDLAQVAAVGLMRAVDRFDPSRGVDFMSYAVPTMIGEVRRYFRDSAWLLHVPRSLKERHTALTTAVADLTHELGRSPTATELAGRLGVPRWEVIESLLAAEAQHGASLDEPRGDDGTASALDTLGAEDTGIANAEDRETLRPHLAALPERERTVLVLRFFHNLTQSEIGARIGVSQMHVSRILAKTLTSLREEMADDG